MKKPQRVLYSCLSRSWGGMEMYTVLSVKKLLERGIDTDLICYPGSKIHETAEEYGLTVHPVKAEGYFHPKQIWETAKLIRKEKFDLGHTQASKDLWLLVPALRAAMSGIPLFMTKQVGSFISKKDILHKLLYGRLTFAFAISRVIEKNLIDTTPLTADKIRLLHNGVDTGKFDPSKTKRNFVRKQFKLREDEIVTGMLARFSWGKGHEEFLYAASELTKKHDNLKFMIVGEPSRGEDEYAQKIKAMAKELGIEKEVVFTGFRSDTPDVLAAMDIFAFPSHSEAFGIALVEAMAAERPVVASASDGVLDINVDGETGYFFEKKNGDDLAEKLEMLITAPEKRKLFGKNARKRAVENFDIEIITDRTIEYYKEGLK